MSVPATFGFDVDDAIKFNHKFGRSIGWYGAIPESILSLDPDLRLDARGSLVEKRRFAHAVSRMQANFPELDLDGKLGGDTWFALLKKYDPVDSAGEYFMFNNRRMKLALAPEYTLRTYDEPGALDFHKHGGFTPGSSKPNRQIKRILIHWGGHSVASCFRALKNRKLTSHFGVEKDHVEQWLDIWHRAHHASWANEDTIGIDVTQQPTTNFLGKYIKEGLDVVKKPNPARRPNGARLGDRDILTLDPRTARTLRNLCQDLCDTFNIPQVLPRNTDGTVSHRLLSKAEFRDFEGILFHSHVSKNKWDIAPWADQIFTEGFNY